MYWDKKKKRFFCKKMPGWVCDTITTRENYEDVERKTWYCVYFFHFSRKRASIVLKINLDEDDNKTLFSLFFLEVVQCVSLKLPQFCFMMLENTSYRGKSFNGECARLLFFRITQRKLGESKGNTLYLYYYYKMRLRGRKKKQDDRATNIFVWEESNVVTAGVKRRKRCTHLFSKNKTCSKKQTYKIRWKQTSSKLPQFLAFFPSSSHSYLYYYYTYTCTIVTVR